MLITLVEDRIADLEPLFADWVASLHALCDKYSDQELTTIIDFLTEAAARQRDAAQRL